MTEDQARSAGCGPVESRESPLVTAKNKPASWLRTILWMLSMVLIVNVVLAIIAYGLYRYKII